ncbi:MAG TPA: cytochrome ubiquinol oxidase subunit I [Ktedonobacteraceae bacterium]|nr:cytochrome ubiquinol oxidase subunit I [Ktedonobacteraceae bacterium]
MEQLLAARAQMGTSLAFHIAITLFGVGLPFFLCITEGLALKTKNPTWLLLTRRWAKATAILFAIGAVSGTIISFELGLLWPTYTKFAGEVVGLPFMLEGFAFFLEAIFLGLYLYGWNRLSPLVHWLCSFPIWIGGLLSAWFIVSANSWMNTPAGFVIQQGYIVDINPWQAILNPSMPYETTHQLLACFVATSFGIAAIYAVAFLRGKRDDYHRKALLLAMMVAIIATPLQLLSGDLNARFLAQAQPVKFAAMEGDLYTEKGPPLRIGGLVDPKTGQVYYAIEIPYGESLLVYGNLTGEIRGLDAFALQDQPDAVPVIHLAFDVMVGCGCFALLITGLFWLLFWRRKRRIADNPWLLRGIVVAGPCTVIAVICGWMVTEMGRQPWVISGFLRTRDAVTPAPWVGVTFLVFVLIYLLLSSALVWLLLGLLRQPLPQAESIEEIYHEAEESVGV